ncbi:MAG: hypothetical protein Q7S03_00200 [bacterium]|nr:hypothetical protein [bacterium]
MKLVVVVNEGVLRQQMPEARRKFLEKICKNGGEIELPSCLDWNFAGIPFELGGGPTKPRLYIRCEPEKDRSFRSITQLPCDQNGVTIGNSLTEEVYTIEGYRDDSETVIRQHSIVTTGNKARIQDKEIWRGTIENLPPFLSCFASAIRAILAESLVELRQAILSS